MMSNAIEDENQLLTVVMLQLVKPGYKQAYEQWLKGIANEAINFEGHLGINKIRS